MTKVSLRHTINHRDLLRLFRSSHQMCFVKKSVFKNFENFTGKHLFNEKRLQHWCFPVKFVKVLRTSILKNSCERLLRFALPQNSIANNSGKFGLDETSTECEVSIFLNVTILFDQMQPYHLYIS